MSFIDKIRILEERYGVNNVRHLPDGGDVFIYLTCSGSPAYDSRNRREVNDLIRQFIEWPGLSSLMLFQSFARHRLHRLRPFAEAARPRFLIIQHLQNLRRDRVLLLRRE